MNEQSQYWKGFERRLSMLEISYKEVSRKLYYISWTCNLIFVLVLIVFFYLLI